jgi:hypothetical protein
LKLTITSCFACLGLLGFLKLFKLGLLLLLKFVILNSFDAC